MLKNVELDVSSESIEYYKKLAQEYLVAINSSLNVVKAGTDNNGDDIFGICLHGPRHQEWYDANTNTNDPNSLMGWSQEKDAYNVLEYKVLPNLGYTIHCKELREFHRNM